MTATLFQLYSDPYHEHNHTWAWWGSGSCSVEEYNSLWKMTVEYYRDEREIHHILYAISTQDISSESEYLNRYPGDDYVDIFGMDSYNNDLSQLEKSLSIVCQLADSRSKIAALTEIGLENLPDSKWFSGYLLKGVQYNVVTKKAAWALVWRNESSVHHFAPYPGHASIPELIQFYNDEFTVFESDLPDMYK